MTRTAIAPGTQLNESRAAAWADGDLRFRAERTDAQTVVLLAGSESFVGSASVSGTNESVSVAAGT